MIQPIFLIFEGDLLGLQIHYYMLTQQIFGVPFTPSASSYLKIKANYIRGLQKKI